MQACLDSLAPPAAKPGVGQQRSRRSRLEMMHRALPAPKHLPGRLPRKVGVARVLLLALQLAGQPSGRPERAPVLARRSSALFSCSPCRALQGHQKSFLSSALSSCSPCGAPQDKCQPVLRISTISADVTHIFQQAGQQIFLPTSGCKFGLKLGLLRQRCTSPLCLASCCTGTSRYEHLWVSQPLCIS